ncbi:TetR/AcrR family transcriptional regulator [Phenylobacterium sp.]|uniref:TetR/AcrR family transcriptional regulator n=1 Tax=Phenylobacterium sp. TaxID=1871053 RepID=UPI0028A0970A|nr:TetR/AcrR family transcriptional regulator [Phenylobacterium sp.]
MSRVRLRRGRRLAPEARRESLLAIAADLLLEQGYLPLGVQDLADGAKVSKALVYKYFPGRHDLYNALLEASLDALSEAVLSAAAREQDAVRLATATAEAYFRYVAQAGPLIQLILRDRFMAGHVSRQVTAFRDRITRRLARALCAQFGLSPRQAVACVGIGLTMPEECGRLVYQGDLDLERGSVLCHELVLGVIDVARRGGLETRR